jgi:hypothetical protein
MKQPISIKCKSGSQIGSWETNLKDFTVLSDEKPIGS